MIEATFVFTLSPILLSAHKKVSSIITRRVTTRGRHPCRFSNVKLYLSLTLYPHQWWGFKFLYAHS